jgi:hypothetical protein
LNKTIFFKDGDLRRALSGSTTDRNNNNATTTVIFIGEFLLKNRFFLERCDELKTTFV